MLFAGLDSTDHHDIFHAVGALLGEQRLRDARNWEHPACIIVRERRLDDDTARHESHLLTDHDFRELLDRAVAKSCLVLGRQGDHTGSPVPQCHLYGRPGVVALVEECGTITLTHPWLLENAYRSRNGPNA